MPSPSSSSIVLAAVTSAALALLVPTDARADGWWEVACNSDGHEGSGGCTNPDNMSACSCETGHSSRSTSERALSVGTGLALLGFVGYRIGRRRRR